jgi:hypothetical protein
MKRGRGGLVARLVPIRRWLQRLRGPSGERRIVLHVGAHKTGSTSLQYLLEANHLRLPPGYDLIRRTDPALLRMKRITYGLKTPEGAVRAGAGLAEAAAGLARAAPRAAVALISHEDFLGHMPMQGGVRGLYPYAPAALRAILDGFASEGVRVEVVLYVRDWQDWMASVFFFRNRDAAPGDFDAARLTVEHGLPDGWDRLVARLRRTCGDNVGFHLCRFEDDRAAGLMGRGYLTAAGLTPRQIARLRRVAPKNVTRPETVAAAEENRSHGG